MKEDHLKQAKKNGSSLGLSDSTWKYQFIHSEVTTNELDTDHI